MRIPIRLYLDHEKDSDLLNYFQSMSSVARNRLIKSLTRQHMAGERETIFDILTRIERNINSLSQRSELQFVRPKNPSRRIDNSEEDDKLENLLDKLGD